MGKEKDAKKALRPIEAVTGILDKGDLKEAYKKTVNFKTSVSKVYLTEYYYKVNEFYQNPENRNKNAYDAHKQNIHIKVLDIMESKIPLIQTPNGIRKMYFLSADSIVKTLLNAKYKAELLYDPYFSDVYRLCSNRDTINNAVYDKALDYLLSELYKVGNIKNAKVYIKHFMINTKRSVLKKDCQYEQILSLYGAQGNGKSRFADSLCEALQGTTCKESFDRMLGRFNNVLVHTGLIHVEEFGYVEKTMTDSLKSLITSNTVSIEQKQKEIVVIPKRFQIIMSSNRNPRDLFYGEIYQRRSAVVKYLGYHHLFDLDVLKLFLKKMWECCPIEYEGYKPSSTADISDKEGLESLDIFEIFAYEFFSPKVCNEFVDLFTDDKRPNAAFKPTTFRFRKLQMIFEDSPINKLNKYALRNFLETQTDYVTTYKHMNGSYSFRFTKALFDKILKMKPEFIRPYEDNNTGTIDREDYIPWKRPSDDFTQQLKDKISELFS